MTLATTHARRLWWLVVYDEPTKTAARAIAVIGSQGPDRSIAWLGQPPEDLVGDLEVDAGRWWPVGVDVAGLIRLIGDIATVGLLEVRTPPETESLTEAVEVLALAAEDHTADTEAARWEDRDAD